MFLFDNLYMCPYYCELYVFFVCYSRSLLLKWVFYLLSAKLIWQTRNFVLQLQEQHIFERKVKMRKKIQSQIYVTIDKYYTKFKEIKTKKSSKMHAWLVNQEARHTFRLKKTEVLDLQLKIAFMENMKWYIIIVYGNFRMLSFDDQSLWKYVFFAFCFVLELIIIQFKHSLW